MLLSEIAHRLGAELHGPDASVVGIADIQRAGPEHLSFLHNPRYAKYLHQTRAAGVLVASIDPDCPSAQIRTANPYLAFAQVQSMFHPEPPAEHWAPSQIHPSARVAPDACLNGAFVGPNARIGAGTRLEPGCHIGANAVLGADCRLGPNVSVAHDCILGDNVHVQAGTAIGSNGFGYATDQGKHHRIPQVGRVIIEDDVDIGANCAIDRGALGDTRIGTGTRIDNLVQIAHNVQIGRGCIITAHCGVSGSTELGDYVVFGGQTAVAGHLRIASGVTLAGRTGVTNNIDTPGTYAGFPARPHREWQREIARLRRLEQMHQRLRRLEEQMTHSELHTRTADEPEQPEH